MNLDDCQRRIVQVTKMNEYVAGYLVELECGHSALLFGNIEEAEKVPCLNCYEEWMEARHDNN